MTSRPYSPSGDHFRQTGRFKPLLQTHQHPLEEMPQPVFRVNFIHSIMALSCIKTEKQDQKETKLWRLYFQEPLSTYAKDSLVSSVEKCFLFIAKNNQLNQHKNADIFMNVNGVLAERIRTLSDQYYASSLDYNCLIVVLKVDEPTTFLYQLDAYQIQTTTGLKQDKQFTQQILVKMKEQLVLFNLLSKGGALSIVNQKGKDYPKLQLNDQNLEQTAADICKNILIIKNLSPRIISLKFLDRKLPQCTQPLHINISNTPIYQLVLYKINRTKYRKYKVEEGQNQEWHSFDEKLKTQNKKGNKTTPQKAQKTGKGQTQKLKINKNSNESTNFVEEEEGYLGKSANRGNILNQPKNLKISQKVITNPKESYLVASESDHAASVKDEKDNQVQFLDDFQNLLYDEQGKDEKQFSLNDSFEQFEKKENNVKNTQILNELNKRKQKQTEEKKKISSMKEKVGQLLNDQKQWIHKNLTLKLQIKRLQVSLDNSESNKQIEEIKAKLNQRRKCEKKLTEQLSAIKHQNNIQELVFGKSCQPKSTQSQRNRHSNFYQKSINVFPKGNEPPLLTSSIRSGKGECNFKNTNTLSPTSSVKNININSANPTPNQIKQSYIPQTSTSNTFFNHDKHKQSSPLNLYSSVPATQSFIQPTTSKNSNTNFKMSFPMTPTNNFVAFANFPTKKNQPEGFMSFPQQKGLVNQNSENKLRGGLDSNKE